MLNGTSSAGKTSIARCLQELLPVPWLRLGIDDLIHAAPDHLLEGPDASLKVSPDGPIEVGSEFRRLERAWYQGLATITHAGVGLIVDEVFLGSTPRGRAARRGAHRARGALGRRAL